MNEVRCEDRENSWALVDLNDGINVGDRWWYVSESCEMAVMREHYDGVITVDDITSWRDQLDNILHIRIWMDNGAYEASSAIRILIGIQAEQMLSTWQQYSW